MRELIKGLVAYELNKYYTVLKVEDLVTLAEAATPDEDYLKNSLTAFDFLTIMRRVDQLAEDYVTSRSLNG